MQNLIKRISALFLCLMVAMTIFPAQAMAAGPIDTQAETSLQVTLAPEGSPAEGVNFDLYRIADVSEACEFSLTGAFAAYPVSLDDPDAESWRVLATTLAGYVASDGPRADSSGTTGENGIANFSGLETGLYLVMGEVYQAGGKNISPTPFLVCLPDRAEDDTWIYDVKVDAKYTSTDVEVSNIEVLKIWDDNSSIERPTEIVVELCRGDSIFDSVTLCGENDWRYEWTDLDGEETWNVREKDVPSGYTVTVEQQGNRFVVTNSKPAPPAPIEPEVPQTGMLWWPVPMLLAAGLLLVIIGLIRRSSADYEG